MICDEKVVRLMTRIKSARRWWLIEGGTNNFIDGYIRATLNFLTSKTGYSSRNSLGIFQEPLVFSNVTREYQFSIWKRRVQCRLMCFSFSTYLYIPAYFINIGKLYIKTSGSKKIVLIFVGAHLRMMHFSTHFIWFKFNYFKFSFLATRDKSKNKKYSYHIFWSTQKKTSLVLPVDTKILIFKVQAKKGKVSAWLPMTVMEDKLVQFNFLHRPVSTPHLDPTYTEPKRDINIRRRRSLWKFLHGLALAEDSWNLLNRVR
jgi:hypothetical protein